MSTSSSRPPSSSVMRLAIQGFTVSQFTLVRSTLVPNSEGNFMLCGEAEKKGVGGWVGG